MWEIPDRVQEMRIELNWARRQWPGWVFAILHFKVWCNCGLELPCVCNDCNSGLSIRGEKCQSLILSWKRKCWTFYVDIRSSWVQERNCGSLTATTRGPTNSSRERPGIGIIRSTCTLGADKSHLLWMKWFTLTFACQSLPARRCLCRKHFYRRLFAFEPVCVLLTDLI